VNRFTSILAGGALLASLALAGCGGSSSSSGAVEGLDVPTTMSVVKAADDSGATKPVSFKTNFGGLAKAFTDADTDYSTDPVNTWVHDMSMEPLQIINEILCMMDQTRAEEMVNQGDYIALIDGTKCRQGQAQEDGSAGQSAAGGKTVQYEKWTVNSSRASNTANQIVKAWVPDDMEGPGAGSQTIRAKVTITEGVSDDKPFGDFVLNFAFYDDTTNLPLGGGTLKTLPASGGKVAYSFFETEGEEKTTYSAGEQFDEQATLVAMAPDGSDGRARTSTYFAGNDGGGSYEEGGAFDLAFNETRMKRSRADDVDTLDSGPTTDACLARDSFNTHVWRYDLYHAADGTWGGKAVEGGDRVELVSGFPFTYDNGGTDVFGHVGYWGVWVEDPDVTLADGAAINRISFTSDTTTPYTVVRAPGKLIRRTAKELTLSKLAGETLNFYGEADPGGGARFGEWQVAFDGSAFNITGEITGWDENGPVVVAVSPAVDITPATNEFLGLWSESLGGAVNFLGGDAFVTFYEEEFVGGDDAVFDGGALTLYCFERCLKGDIAQSDVDAGWDGPYRANATDLSTGVTTYAIDPADMTLTVGGVDVAPVTGVDTSGTEHEWGMQTGEMVTASVKDGMSQIWDVWNPSVVTVTYRWETGTNDWNQYVAVKDADGNCASFDKPIQFAYEHATANDANDDATYDGRTFRLNYGGNGDLWGIPWEVDGTTGRWSAAFTIKDGTVMGPTGTEFVIKAREKEQSMAEVASSECSSLAFGPLLFTWPTAADGTPDIGTKPTVTDPPAVIGGELQTTES
jgi:hypothetical protein